MHWRGRTAPFVLAAAATFLAGVSSATLGRWSARRAQAEAEGAVARHAERLALATATALAAARARADTLATTALVRTAVETDAATVRDIVGSDRALQPRPGEQIELFQARDGKRLRALLHPGTPLPPDGAGVLRVDPDARALLVAASAPVEPLYVRGALTGAVTVVQRVALEGNAAPWTTAGARGLHIATPGAAFVVGGPAREARVSAVVPVPGVPLRVSLPIDSAGAGVLVVLGRLLLIVAFGLGLAALLRMRRARDETSAMDEAVTSALAIPFVAGTPPPSTVTPPPGTRTPTPTSRTPPPGSYTPPPASRTPPPGPRTPPPGPSTPPPTESTPSGYLPLRRVQPTRTVRLPLPHDSGPVRAAPTPSPPPPAVPSPVVPELTAKAAPHARDDDARRVVLAWSAPDPTPIPTLSPFFAESAPVVIDPRADQLQSRYRLIKPIGRGHGADVYLAQSRLPGAPPAVALKLLSPSLPPQDLERQLVAARAQQQLSHPNIVRVLDVGEGALPFVAMEYVEGCNLEQLYGGLGAESLPAAQAVQIALALCRALEAARSADGTPLVHGALKPRNVLVGRRDAIKLGDFGAPAAPSDRLAPEQYAGKPGDARTDVYALGVLLHELLTGERVYPVDGQERRWPALPPPSSRRADVPPALDAVIARATRFVPRWRQSHAAALGRELERAAAGLAAAPSRLSDFVERARRSL